MTASTPTRHRPLTLAVALVAIAVVPSVARGDGLPVPVEDTGPAGIAEPEGAHRYISTDIGADTLVQRTVQNGGQVSRSRIINGTFTIPAVAVNGSPAGLSGDGETLVLIRPRPRPGLPRETTGFVVLDTERLRVRDTIRLDGDFSFDAISPDGRWMYLIEYVGTRDLSRYQVRRYDLERGRLDPEPIVDPTIAHEVMAGLPLARATDAEGRWAYTLYANYRGRTPFIHALDTERGEALCINLPGFKRTNVYALDLETAPGGDLVVTRRGVPEALVDTETFEVTEPPAPGAATPAANPGEQSDEGGGFQWLLGAAGTMAGLAALGVLVVRRRRHRGGRLKEIPTHGPEIPSINGGTAAASETEAREPVVPGAGGPR